jgi:recombination protein RecT
MAADQKADAARDAVRDAASGELAVRTEPTLRELVEVQQSEIARALPMAMDAARYVRIVQTELRKNPNLMKCSPQSFLGAVLTAAQLGLEFGPLQQAYLVPYGTEIQLIIGYRGWLTLMNRSAEILSVSARTVFAKDTFSYEYGLDENLIHKPASGDRGAPVAYYAVIRKTNGGRSFAVMTREEMIKHRDRYGKKGGRLTGPWADKDQEEAMCWKTAFLRAKTWVPLSAETQMAQDVDNHVVRRMTVDEEPEIERDELPDDDGVVDAEIVGDDQGEHEDLWAKEDREARERGE